MVIREVLIKKQENREFSKVKLWQIREELIYASTYTYRNTVGEFVKEDKYMNRSQELL